MVPDPANPDGPCIVFDGPRGFWAESPAPASVVKRTVGEVFPEHRTPAQIDNESNAPKFQPLGLKTRARRFSDWLSLKPSFDARSNLQRTHRRAGSGFLQPRSINSPGREFRVKRVWTIGSTKTFERVRLFCVAGKRRLILLWFYWNTVQVVGDLVEILMGMTRKRVSKQNTRKMNNGRNGFGASLKLVVCAMKKKINTWTFPFRWELRHATFGTLSMLRKRHARAPLLDFRFCFLSAFCRREHRMTENVYRRT